MELKRRGDIAQQVQDSVDQESASQFISNTGNFALGTVSTGSTLADLAISGTVYPGGGLPGGIMVEIFGPESSGKTSILSEIIASVQGKKGIAKVRDPEGRYNAEYAKMYGVDMENVDYSRPDTVREVLEEVFDWDAEDTNPDHIDLFACDSIAALSTDMEMEGEDKMGGKRAREFSAGLRKAARVIARNNKLVIFTNQIRESMASFGAREVTPGGRAIRFYASIRARVSMSGKIDKSIKIGGKEIKRVIGIVSKFYVSKSSIDWPYREADLYIMFGYGIDDIRANLQYLKDMQKLTSYKTPDDWSTNSMEKAIERIEVQKMHLDLKKQVIELWNEVEERMRVERQPKVRF